MDINEQVAKAFYNWARKTWIETGDPEALQAIYTYTTWNHPPWEELTMSKEQRDTDRAARQAAAAKRESQRVQRAADANRRAQERAARDQKAADEAAHADSLIGRAASWLFNTPR